MEKPLYTRSRRNYPGPLTPAEFRKLDELLTMYWLEHTTPDSDGGEQACDLVNAVRVEARRHEAQVRREQKASGGLSKPMINGLRIAATDGGGLTSTTFLALWNRGLVTGSAYVTTVTEAGQAILSRLGERDDG